MAALLFGVVVVVGVMIALGGTHRPPDTLAIGSAWLDELRTPRHVIAHRLKGRATSGAHALEGWATLEARDFQPDTPEARSLSELFKKGKLKPTVGPKVRCDGFNADLGLEFIAPEWRRVVLFDLVCPQLQGDSGIKEFDPVAVAAWAATLFPDEPRYDKLAHPDQAP